MINHGFQSNQDYMDRKFYELKTEVKGVDKKLDSFIESYNEEKLPMRVEYIENMLNLHKK